MTCQDYKNLFAEAYYQELKGEQRADFDQHLAACEGCSTEYHRMAQALALMDKRNEIKPDGKFLAAFWDSLRLKIDTKTEDIPAARLHAQKRVLLSFSVPSWAYGIAAMLILGLGVYLGKTFFTPQPPVENRQQVADNVAGQNRGGSSASTDTLDREVSNYLDRSKVLLQGVINSPTEGDEGASFGRQQKVSRELIQKAVYLKASLKNANQENLRQLIADLELVLIQLANYSADNSVPLIEMVKQGVDKKSILLKINLEQLRALDPKIKKQNNNVTNGHKS